MPRRTSSPVRCPPASLTRLKRSTSIAIRASGRPWRRARRVSTAMRSMNARWLTRPVSPSVAAWCSSAARASMLEIAMPRTWASRARSSRASARMPPAECAATATTPHARVPDDTAAAAELWRCWSTSARAHATPGPSGGVVPAAAPASSARESRPSASGNTSVVGASGETTWIPATSTRPSTTRATIPSSASASAAASAATSRCRAPASAPSTAARERRSRAACPAFERRRRALAPESRTRSSSSSRLRSASSSPARASSPAVWRCSPSAAATRPSATRSRRPESRSRMATAPAMASPTTATSAGTNDDTASSRVRRTQSGPGTSTGIERTASESSVPASVVPSALWTR